MIEEQKKKEILLYLDRSLERKALERTIVRDELSKKVEKEDSDSDDN